LQHVDSSKLDVLLIKDIYFELKSIVPIYSLALGGLLLCVSMIAQHGPIFGQFLLVFFAFYNWLPVLNPLVTIFTIDDYRPGLPSFFFENKTKNSKNKILGSKIRFLKKH
jgi:hypothetical protein